MNFDPNKPVRTRGGRGARIVATDMHNPPYNILALIQGPSNVEYAAYRRANGMASDYALPDDLVNIPERRFRNLYITSAISNVASSFEDLRKPKPFVAKYHIGILVTDVIDGKEVNPRIYPKDWNGEE